MYKFYIIPQVVINNPFILQGGAGGQLFFEPKGN